MHLPTIVLLATRLAPKGVEPPPYRQPQLAAAHGKVAMAFGAGTSIYFTASADGGRTFAAPRKVTEVGVLALGRHRGPRVTILKDSILITAVVGAKLATGTHAHGLPDDGDLVSWRSADGGQTWVRGPAVNDAPGAAREGLHAIAADRDGNLFAAWLDLRTKGTRLYGARSADGGRTWSKNTQLYESPDGTICQCCAPALAAGSDGRFTIMWRNVIDGARDLYVAAPGGPARKLGVGTWKINACPMDGGGLVVQDGVVTSAWRREGDAYLAREGAGEKKLGAGKDVALVMGKDGPYVAWTAANGPVVLGPRDAQPRVLGPAGGFVSIVALPDGAVLAAWENGGAIETKRVDSYSGSRRPDSAAR